MRAVVLVVGVVDVVRILLVVGIGLVVAVVLVVVVVDVVSSCVSVVDVEVIDATKVCGAIAHDRGCWHGALPGASQHTQLDWM